MEEQKKIPVEIDASSVIKLILQFCKEQKLSKTFQTLQEETQISLNALEDVDRLEKDILEGKWDSVLLIIQGIQLPIEKLYNLYEHIVLEMIELGEVDTARQIMDQTPVFSSFKRYETDRYIHLDRLLSKSDLDPKEVFAKSSKRELRKKLAKDIINEIEVVPSNRLLSLLGQAMKWQQYMGYLPPGTKFDLFRGKAPEGTDEVETYPTIQDQRIKFGKKSFAQCAVFSPDGQFLVTGSTDNFIEVWDYDAGKINLQLKYQANDEFMMHDAPILCLAFSRDSEYLASGSQDGMIKVWNIHTGQCLRRLERAHTSGVTCIKFSKDGTQLLSGSHDGTIRVHGLRSSRMLKEYNGHQSFVNDVTYSSDETKILSVSSDGTVKIWNVRSMVCIKTIRPPHTTALEPKIHTIKPMPNAVDQYVISSVSTTISIITIDGNIIKNFSYDTLGDFVCCTVSPKGNWIYAASDKNMLLCFNVEQNKMVYTMQIHKKAILGLVHHPHRNLIASFSEDGSLRLWKA